MAPILRRLAPMGLAVAVAPGAQAAVMLELYGTFDAMGVVVTVDAGDDVDRDVVATVSYRTAPAAFGAGLGLFRVDAKHFVGNLFRLEPGTSYDARVVFSDPGDALHGATVEGAAATRAEIAIPAATASHVASPAGSGSACTAELPCALATALSQVQAGEEVVLQNGTYFTGDLSVP